MPKIYRFALGALNTNSYLIVSDSGGAVLVDAPEGAARAAKTILEKEGAELGALLLTHCHWDHVWDAALLKDAGAKIFAGEEGRMLLESRGFQEKYYSPAGMRPAKIDVFPRDGEILELCGLKIECRSAPGHCPGSLLYFLPRAEGGAGALYSGDVVFLESVGRADLPGGNYLELKKSILEKVYTLPGETEIFPGHGPSTSVAHEKANNPFVRGV